MFSLRKPTAEQVQRFLEEQRGLPFSYPEVGEITGTIPPKYNVDHTRAKLGEGEETYQSACRALRAWTPYQLTWTELFPAGAPQTPGETVVVVAWAAGLWSINACRVIRQWDGTGEQRRFGYSYGTLAGHAANGEERFWIEWDEGDGSVWFDVLAFSRPKEVLAWLGYPWMRRAQRRFGREATAAMRRAVSSVPV